MFRKCINDFDERQLLQRGNVFKHGIILFFLLVAANAFLKEEGVTWAEGMWENLLIIWAVLGLCLGEFAVKEIFPIGGGMTVIYLVEGLCGLFLSAMCLTEVITGREAMLIGPHTLSRTGAQMISGGIMVLLLLVFLGKKVYNHRKGDTEDEA